MKRRKGKSMKERITYCNESSKEKSAQAYKGCISGQKEVTTLGQGSLVEQDKAALEPNLPFPKLWVLFTTPHSLQAGLRVNQAE